MHETNIDYTHARMSILLKVQWSKISLASNLIGISTQPTKEVLWVLDILDKENSTYDFVTTRTWLGSFRIPNFYNGPVNDERMIQTFRLQFLWG